MIDAQIGTFVEAVLPYSEVCVHLGVAGKEMLVAVIADGAQLFDDDGRLFSMPITWGEAGLRVEKEGDAMCFTCGLEMKVIIPDLMESKHMRHDGAHEPSWYVGERLIWN